MLCYIRGHRDIADSFATYPRCKCGAFFNWASMAWSKDPQKPLPVSVYTKSATMREQLRIQELADRMVGQEDIKG